MSVKTNKNLVLEFYRAFDNRDIDKAFSYLGANFIAHLAGISEALDCDGFKKFGMGFYSAFTNSRHQFDEVIVQDDKVVTCGTFSAVHTGEFQGLPPSKKQIKISIMHIDRIEQEKIIEHWGQGDAQGLMQQLGVMFFPSPKLLLSVLKNKMF